MSEPLLQFKNFNWDIEYVNGEVVEDKSFYNNILISIFSYAGYWADELYQNESERIGNIGYENFQNKPITTSYLNELQSYITKKISFLDNLPTVENFTVEVSNPLNDRITIIINVQEKNGARTMEINV